MMNYRQDLMNGFKGYCCKNLVTWHYCPQLFSGLCILPSAHRARMDRDSKDWIVVRLCHDQKLSTADTHTVMSILTSFFERKNLTAHHVDTMHISPKDPLPAQKTNAQHLDLTTPLHLLSKRRRKKVLRKMKAMTPKKGTMKKKEKKKNKNVSDSKTVPMPKRPPLSGTTITFLVPKESRYEVTGVLESFIQIHVPAQRRCPHPLP